MKRLILLAPIALAACNSGGPTVTATNASAGEVAAKVEAATAGQSFVSPGHWDGTMTISEMSLPGMPAQMAEKMKTSMAKAKTFASCLTPEEAKQPKGRFFGGQSDQCRYDHFTMAGGAIDSVMKCNIGGMERTMTMKGNYSPDSYKMTVVSAGTATAANPMSGMTMTMTMEAKRTGECTGKETS